MLIMSALLVLFFSCTDKEISKKENQSNPEIDLYEKYKDSPEKQEEYLNELLRLNIRRTLGENFPENKIKKMIEVTEISRKNKRNLVMNLQNGSITQDVYMQKQKMIFDELDRNYQNLLTPSEYKKFMGQAHGN